MSTAGLRNRLLRAVLEQSVVADTMEEGLDILIRRLDSDLPRAALATLVQEIVTSGLAREPVRLPPGALQCHWHLELSPVGQEVALQL